MKDESNKKRGKKNVPRQSLTNVFNGGSFLQPIWVRCGSICSNIVDRKFMESQLRFVFYCGGVFWIIYLLSQIV